MKQALSVVLFAGLSWALIADRASADGMSGPVARPTPVGPALPPFVIRPRPVPPVVRLAPPPVMRVAPPVVVAPPAAPVAPPYLTNNAWIGQNPTTRMFSIAFDAPGVGGTGILINAGYTNIVRGPTNWVDATNFLKSIGAPGW